MDLDDDEHRVVAESQDIAHGDNHDYTVGSPHLRHAALRNTVDGLIRNVIKEILHEKGHCDVLEIGAGHGSFTDTVLSAGGTPTVTEMSHASYDFLARRFRDAPDVRVVFDPDGNEPIRAGTQYDVILLLSVIHHIPDYISTVLALSDECLRPGGAVVTFQDPLWYPRQSRRGRALSQGSYFAWRVTQGAFRRGLATQWRRMRGIYDETKVSDLVEYHVVRQGVDEVALTNAFKLRFATVEVIEYFSTQSPLFQRIGDKLFPCNTFGLVSRQRLNIP